jgi:hypothetical protein
MLNTGLKGRFWPIFFFKQRRRGTKDSCDSPTRCADVLALTAAKEALDRGIRRMRQHHDRSHDPGKVRRFRRKPRHHVSNYDGRRGRVLACSSSAARFRTSVPRFASRRLGETRISRPGQDGYPIGAWAKHRAKPRFLDAPTMLNTGSKAGPNGPTGGL